MASIGWSTSFPVGRCVVWSADVFFHCSDHWSIFHLPAFLQNIVFVMQIFCLELKLRHLVQGLAALGRLLSVASLFNTSRLTDCVAKATCWNDTALPTCSLAHHAHFSLTLFGAIPQPAAGWKRKDLQQMMTIDKDASCTPLHTSLVPMEG